MTDVTWSGLTRHGMWNGFNIVIRKMTRKITSPARIEEMLRLTVLLESLNHPHLVKVRHDHQSPLSGTPCLYNAKLGHAEFFPWPLPFVLQLRGCTLEPDCGLAFDKPQGNWISLLDWCASQPCVDEIADLSELALAIAVRVKIAQEVATALMFLASHGQLHGDLKSWSVFLEVRRGGQVAVRVTDYCLVRAKDKVEVDGGAEESTIVRAIDYVAPEQWTNPQLVTTEADVYAWGILLLELMAGRRGLQWRGSPASAADRSSFVRRKWINQRYGITGLCSSCSSRPARVCGSGQRAWLPAGRSVHQPKCHARSCLGVCIYACVCAHVLHATARVLYPACCV